MNLYDNAQNFDALTAIFCADKNGQPCHDPWCAHERVLRWGTHKRYLAWHDEQRHAVILFNTSMQCYAWEVMGRKQGDVTGYWFVDYQLPANNHELKMMEKLGELK